MVTTCDTFSDCWEYDYGVQQPHCCRKKDSAQPTRHANPGFQREGIEESHRKPVDDVKAVLECRSCWSAEAAAAQHYQKAEQATISRCYWYDPGRVER